LSAPRERPKLKCEQTNQATTKQNNYRAYETPFS
jgi:hypothetical protein